MNRKTILFIPYGAEKSEATREMMLIVRYLDKERYLPVILLPRESSLRDEFGKVARVIESDIAREPVGLLGRIRAGFAQLRLLRKIKPDLLYCNTIMSSNWLLFAKIVNMQTIVHVHELEYQFDALSSMDRYLLHNFSDCYLASSSVVRKYLLSVSGLQPSKIVLFQECIEVPPAITDPLAIPGLDIKPGHQEVVVAAVGRVAYAKGTDIFVDAVAAIRKLLPPDMKVRFVISGDLEGNEQLFFETVKDRIAAGNLRDDIIVTGYLGHPAGILALVDIVVFPSREEPLPLSVLDAMAAGKPIVAFAVGGVTEAVGDEAGILVPATNLDALCTAVVKLVREPDQRAKLGAAARVRVEQRFNIVRTISQLEQIIDSVTGV
jgi:glycosyltransferase involved in cell wall biosynthesis